MTNGIPAIVLDETDTARLDQAVILRAARFAGLPSVPFGVIGAGDESQTQLRRDHEIADLLVGLRLGAGVDLTTHTWPTVAEIVDAAYGVLASPLPASQLAKIERARLAAISWIRRYVTEAAGVA